MPLMSFHLNIAIWKFPEIGVSRYHCIFFLHHILLTYSLHSGFTCTRAIHRLVIELNNVKNEASLPDNLSVRSWQHQFCEASLKNWKLGAELRSSCQCVLRISHPVCLKYCACQNERPCHAKCCTCHAESSQQTWRSDAPKCNPSGNQRPAS